MATLRGCPCSPSHAWLSVAVYSSTSQSLASRSRAPDRRSKAEGIELSRPGKRSAEARRHVKGVALLSSLTLTACGRERRPSIVRPKVGVLAEGVM